MGFAQKGFAAHTTKHLLQWVSGASKSKYLHNNNIGTTNIFAEQIYLHNKMFPHNKSSASMGIWRQKKKIFAKLIYLHIKKVC